MGDEYENTEDDMRRRRGPGRGPGGRGPGGRGPAGMGGWGPGGRGRGWRGPGGPRASRGDVRAAAIALLAEEPMHGYQIIQELESRTNGAWQPSPGSVYPALKQLADDGLVSSSEQDGKNVFELTDLGRTAATEADQDDPPWVRLTAEAGSVDLRQTIGSVAAAAIQVSSNGTTEQVAKAEEILVEARKSLYRLLAE